MSHHSSLLVLPSRICFRCLSDIERSGHLRVLEAARGVRAEVCVCSYGADGPRSLDCGSAGVVERAGDHDVQIRIEEFEAVHVICCGDAECHFVAGLERGLVDLRRDRDYTVAQSHIEYFRIVRWRGGAAVARHRDVGRIGGVVRR